MSLPFSFLFSIFQPNTTNTGRKRLILPFKSWEEKQAQTVWDNFKFSYKGYFLADETVNARFVKKVARKLIDAAGLGKDKYWEIYVVESPEVNAFVLPGANKIVVFTGQFLHNVYFFDNS
jgi:Zn-dependent protease with chaperone function